MNKIELLTSEINKLENKESVFYFYVIDTMGAPHSFLNYIYNQAQTLSDYGFKVKILHEEEEYYGVADWMGEKYMELEHLCVKKDEITVSPSDFLFIPELLSPIMNQVKDLPCKKIVLCEDYDKVFEFLPYGFTWDKYNISHIVAVNNEIKKKLLNVFPSYTNNITVIEPFISDKFTTPSKPKDLTIGILSNNQNETKKFIKEFMLKVPYLRWVSFKELLNHSDDILSEELKSTAFVINLNTNDDLYLNVLKCVECDCITISKLNGKFPEWCGTEENPNYGVIFEENTHSMIQDLKTIIEVWCSNKTPLELFNHMEQLKFTYKKQKNTQKVLEFTETLINNRIKELNNNKIKMQENE